MNTLFKKTPSCTPVAVRRGFTLIELLTVIAIIGILAAIIIPTVGMVRKKAKAIDCLSRLRQMGTAVRLFADENKGMAPPWRGAPTDATIPGAQGVLWTQALFSYMNIKAATSSGSPVLPNLPDGTDYSKVPNYFFICPDSPLPVYGRSWGNYVVHPEIMKANAAGPFYKISKVARPSQVILIADGTQTDAGDQVYYSLYGSASSGGDAYFSKTYATANASQPISKLDDGNPNKDGANNVGWFRYRHNNSVQCLFLDGHVAAKPVGSLNSGDVIEKN